MQRSPRATTSGRRPCLAYTECTGRSGASCREGPPDLPGGPCGQCGCGLRGAGVPEDVEPEVAVGCGHVLLAVRSGEDLDAPEVVAALVDVVTDLDERAVDDLRYPEAAGVVGEVGQVGPPERGRYLVHGKVAEAGGEGRVVRLRDRIGVEFGHLAVAVAEQVHVAPAVEVR